MAWTNVIVEVTGTDTTRNVTYRFHDPVTGREKIDQQHGFQTDAQIGRYAYNQQLSLTATDNIKTKPGDVVDVSPYGPTAPTSLETLEARYNAARGWLIAADTDNKLGICSQKTLTAVTTQAVNARIAFIDAGGKLYGPTILVDHPSPSE